MHSGVNMAAHLESTYRRKGFIKILTRRLLVGIEKSIDINLMYEAILIGESHCLATNYGDFGRMKGPALLRHIEVGCLSSRRRKQQEDQERAHDPNLTGTSKADVKLAFDGNSRGFRKRVVSRSEIESHFDRTAIRLSHIRHGANGER